MSQTINAVRRRQHSTTVANPMKAPIGSSGSGQSASPYASSRHASDQPHRERELATVRERRALGDEQQGAER